jgi:hypothetical protein
MHVGSCIVSNMAYNPMDRCPPIVHSDRAMIRFKHFSPRRVLGNVRIATQLVKIVFLSSVIADVPRTVFIDLEPTVIGEDHSC